MTNIGSEQADKIKGPKYRAMYLNMLEYFKLKDEQIRRIEFRDTMIHVQLISVGGVAAWALTEQVYLSLLVIPWICFVLGWTYIANDDKISEIGRYIRERLDGSLRQFVDIPTNDLLFYWEIFHRSDRRRVNRKIWQFIADQVAFVASGFVALGLFLSFATSASVFSIVFACLEFLLLFALGVQFYKYADFKKEKP